MVSGQWYPRVTTHYLPLVRSFSAAQRGSTSFVSHSQSPVFLSMPQTGQIPLQSGWHSILVGTASKICSFTTSPTSIVSPSKTDTDIISSVSSAVAPDSYSAPVMYCTSKSALTGISTCFRQRSHSTWARVSMCPLTKTSAPASRTFPLTLTGSTTLTRSSNDPSCS